MAFNNIPPNGFPALPDVEDLEAVVKDVANLKTSVTGLTEDVGDLDSTKANKTDIATEFSDLTNYNAGDLVYYEGALYEFQADHTAGSWETSEVIQKDLSDIVNTLKSGLNELTANKLNGTDDITATTYDTAYVCPCDGYLMVSSNTDSTGTIRVVIADAISNESVGFVYMNVTGQYQIEMVFLRKGLKVYISQATTNSVVRFKKLTT